MYASQVFLIVFSLPSSIRGCSGGEGLGMESRNGPSEGYTFMKSSMLQFFTFADQ